MIALDSVTMRAGEATLLREVSLQVRPGRVTAVIGPNGAGKTTALRTLCGDLGPVGGSVTIDGEPLRSIPHARIARRRAVVPQRSSLDFPFTVHEVVMLGRTPHPSRPAFDCEIVDEALRIVSLGALADRDYTTLSGGERQRVHLARALAQIWEATAQRSAYLLLDEPTASLDPAHQHRVLAIAREWAARGVGVLTVLHDLNLAAEYADEIALLRGGRLLAAGPVREVLQPDLLERAFSMPMHVALHPYADHPLILPVAPSRAGVGLTGGQLHHR